MKVDHKGQKDVRKFCDEGDTGAGPPGQVTPLVRPHLSTGSTGLGDWHSVVLQAQALRAGKLPEGWGIPGLYPLGHRHQEGVWL